MTSSTERSSSCPNRAPEHLRYSLTHSLKQVDDGWTWKQDSPPP